MWIAPELLERCRNAVVSIAEGYSFTRLLDDALSREVRCLELEAPCRPKVSDAER